MTMADILASHVINEALEDDTFCEYFCLSCPCGHGGEDYECPAGWCPDDKHCYRSGDWSDFCKGVTACFANAMTH